MPVEHDSTLPPAWEQMLAQIEQALAATIEAANRRQQALAAAGAVPPAPALDLTPGLAQLDERVRALTACAGRGEQTVAEADGALAAGEDALRAWFQAAEGTRRKLADRTAQA